MINIEFKYKIRAWQDLQERVPAAWELGKDALWYCLPEDDETKMPPPPHSLVNALDRAKTARAVEDILAKWEKRIARMSNSYFGDYLSCYNANFLFSDVLRTKKISHKVVCGRDEDGFGGHIWIISNGKNYDMTRQGFGKKYVVWYSYKF